MKPASTGKNARTPGRTGRTSALVAALLLLPAASPAQEIVFKTRDIGIITVDQLVDELGKARIVVLGEHHNDFRHHRAQLRVLQGLVESGAEVAVGLEMFRSDAQADLDLWIRGELSDSDFTRLFAEHWDITLWADYRPIFLLAREKGLALVGLNISRSITRQISREGFASLDEAQRDDVQNVTCSVGKEYESALRGVFGRDLDEKVFQNICEAQVYWDTVMAKRAVDYVSRHPRAVMVVLAGSTHAWKYGIPARVESLSDLPVLTVMPSEDSSYLNYDVLLEDADYVWWYQTPP